MGFYQLYVTEEQDTDTHNQASAAYNAIVTEYNITVNLCIPQYSSYATENTQYLVFEDAVTMTFDSLD